MKFIMMITISLILAVPSTAQDYNTEEDPFTGKPMIVGYFDDDAFADDPYSEWFTSEYESYQPDENVLPLIDLKEYDVTIVLGTWCSDSRREVPRFFKILDETGYDPERVTLIGVDREKTAEGIDTEGMNIEKVPTFIFYRDGEEVGRIIETPEMTLELDIVHKISRE